jgi:hypothetical protein
MVEDLRQPRPAIEWKYGDPIDPSAIAAFETSKQIELPASFKAIAAANDGAVPYPDGIAVPDAGRAGGHDIVGIGQLHRFVGQEESGWSISEANEAYEHAYPGLVFFSEAANGWGFAFDYRSCISAPRIVLVRFGEGGGEVVPVASSFDAMIAAVLDHSSVGRPEQLISFHFER